jgi:hypothetical protein
VLSGQTVFRGPCETSDDRNNEHHRYGWANVAETQWSIPINYAATYVNLNLIPMLEGLITNARRNKKERL